MPIPSRNRYAESAAKRPEIEALAPHEPALRMEKTMRIPVEISNELLRDQWSLCVSAAEPAMLAL